MTIKIKIKCSTCRNTAMMDAPDTMPHDWEQDAAGKLHCSKCAKLAHAILDELRREGN